MPTDFYFRLSTYLALALVCAAIGYAEFPILPEVGFITGVVILTLGVLFWLETRVELLSIPAANRLGLVIALGYAVWATFRITDEVRRPELVHLNWQLMVVSLFGPLLVTLLPAKLARREKHAGDYWALHLAGLVAAGLAAALGEDLVCFVLLGLYVCCAVWSLSLFYLRRAGGAIAPIPGKQAPAASAGVVDGHASGGLGRALAFTAAGVACAVPLYLVTPRSPADKLNLGRPRVEIGYAADQMIDLTRTGELRPNQEVAFEVDVEAGGRLVADLPTDLRWRGRLLGTYATGVWVQENVRLPQIQPRAKKYDPATRWSPPQLGPGSTP
jgi:protein-glutamine gamma-glutamyltransferase